MFGLAPVWAPVLFYDVRSSRLFMFYSESRKAYSPGGDIKYVTSADAGTTWSAPATIYTHEEDGEVPKIAVAKPAVAANGNWYLAFHREPAQSFETFNAKTFSALRDAGDAIPVASPPATAPPQSMTTSAGVLISRDAGATWAAGGTVEDAKTWLVEPSIECVAKGALVMMMRTAAGRAYSARSTDHGATWSKPAPTPLLNPNSKLATVTIDGQMLAAYNASATARTPLSLALSVDEGKSWDTLMAVDAEPEANYSYPSIVEWSEDTVKIAYTVWGVGLKLATVKLATVEG
jgi:predicted neuraminidase